MVVGVPVIGSLMCFITVNYEVQHRLEIAAPTFINSLVHKWQLLLLVLIIDNS